MPNNSVTVFFPNAGKLTQYMFTGGETISPASAKGWTIESPYPMADNAPMSGANSLDLTSRDADQSLCVFVAIPASPENRHGGLFLYEMSGGEWHLSQVQPSITAIYSVASAAWKNDAGEFDLKLRQTSVSTDSAFPSIPSFSVVVPDEITFTVIYQTADNKVMLTERAGHGAWYAPIEIATLSAPAGLSLVVDSATGVQEIEI